MGEDAKDTVSASYNYRWHMDDFKSQHIPDILRSTAMKKKNGALELKFRNSVLYCETQKSQLQSSLTEEHN